VAAAGNKESSMDLFKSFTMKWWQAGILKAGMWGIGIAVGAYWHNFFGGFLPELIAIGAVCLGYITYLWLQQ
jgi:hypothetical protein